MSLAIGDRDPRTGEVVLKGGVSEGAPLLRYPTATWHDGQAVEMASQLDSPVLSGPGPLTTASGR